MIPTLTETDESSTSFTKIRSLAGSPARIVLHDSRSGEGLLKVPGIIRQVSSVGIVVDLYLPLVAPPTRCPIVLEIMSPDALLQCFTSILHSSYPQRVNVAIPEEVHTIQRRRFPRATVSVETSLKDGNGLAQGGFILTNISAGGCSIHGERPLAEGMNVKLNLDGLGLIPPEVGAVVVRCAPSPSPSGPWEVGLSFSHLLPEQIQCIMGYVSLHS